MWSDEVKLEGRLFLEDREPWADCLISMLGLIPPDFRPKYFSKNERKHKRPEFEVANEPRFREAIQTNSCHVLFGDGYELSVGWKTAGREETSLFASSLANGGRLMTEWIPKLDGRLYYASAGVPDEYEHRNGATIHFVERYAGHLHSWVGRDIDRYVPGLYWLNYFSQAFAQKHEIDVEALVARTGGRVQALEKGLTLQLYDSPMQWTEWQERIDEVLATTPHFFSKRHVTWPKDVRAKGHHKVLGEFWRQWP